MHAYPPPSAVDYEHISLSTEDPEECLPNFMPSAVALRLEQLARRQRRQFAIFDRCYLDVRIDTPPDAARRYWLNLAYVDPSPGRVVSRGWWRASGAAAGLCLGLLVIAWLSGAAAAHAWAPPLAATVAALLLSLGLALQRSGDRLVYVSRHGRVPVVELLRRAPNRGQVEKFRAALEDAIRQAAAGRRVERARWLRDELREHRRLLEHGALQGPDFEQAKARILRAHG
jgi:hypothetical protein